MAIVVTVGDLFVISSNCAVQKARLTSLRRLVLNPPTIDLQGAAEILQMWFCAIRLSVGSVEYAVTGCIDISNLFRHVSDASYFSFRMRSYDKKGKHGLRFRAVRGPDYATILRVLCAGT